jgi:hypothetical protein
MLARSVGLPFFVLAAMSPLIQAWFSRTVSASPYRLYALSNTGSLLALLTYPFFFEPLYTRNTQAALWADAFGGFAIFSTVTAILFALAAKSRFTTLKSPVEPPAPAPTARIRRQRGASGGHEQDLPGHHRGTPLLGRAPGRLPPVFYVML